MSSLIHCSIGNIDIFSRTTSIQTKRTQLAKCKVPHNRENRTFYAGGFDFPQSSLYRPRIYKFFFTHGHESTSQIVAAVGTDVTVDDLNSIVSEEGEEEGNSLTSVRTSKTAPRNPVIAPTARIKRPRSSRKSEMPPVKDEELIPGTSFIGKVRSIQPFGAFIDFGAFTDGLVHVSRISDEFVKDVAAAVSIGQEVKVKIVEVNKETGRISLTMRDGDNTNKTQQKKEAPANASEDKTRNVKKNAARSNQKRDDAQKSTKLVKGQVLDGTVKNIIRSGAFISLPDGEEGFLPVSEETEGFGNIMGNSSLQVGQEVKARVLRISRGQATLTMKKEEDVEAINRQFNRGVVHVATNPFELAFRQNKDIAAFLDERERMQKKTLPVIEEKIIEFSVVNEEVVAADSSPSVLGQKFENPTSEALQEDDSASKSTTEEQISSGVKLESESPQDASFPAESFSQVSDGFSEAGAVAGSSNAILGDEEKQSDVFNQLNSKYELKIPASEVNGNEGYSDVESSVEDDIPITNEVEGNSISTATISETEQNLRFSDAEQIGIIGIKTSGSYATDELKGNEIVDLSVSQVKESSEGLTFEEGQREVSTLENSTTVEFSATDEDEEGTSSVIILSEDIRDKLEPVGLEDSSKNVDGEAVPSEVSFVEITNDELGSSGNPDQRTAVKAISPSLVKQLREETGAGMMDCKKALAETDSDIVKAQEFLRRKGLAGADKKASRTTAEGRIGSYIHDNRIGVLIEVNCETDFVSRGEIFEQLVDDLAMQVAACPHVQYLVPEDVPDEISNKEREIEMQREDLMTKPEQIRSKIIDGRVKKRLAEFALMEQPYIKNDKMVVKDWVKQAIATVGENIKVKRFVRYNLGEGMEKKSQDFAAEVAAQTAGKPSPSVSKDQSAKSKETGEKPPAATIPAALVKQLREETGAGMMDCKRALSETGGDFEKALEYLRRKGLSAADKKSSRLTAEGRISSYIHDSRLGCLIEVNCETDFVARNEKFIELVDDLAMQVVACPQVGFVSMEDIPENIVNKEREIEMQRDDLQSKPENVREKIVEGRVSKRLGELALLEQPFIKNDGLKVKDLVKEAVAALGENIKVRRFVRYGLGEEIQYL